MLNTYEVLYLITNSSLKGHTTETNRLAKSVTHYWVIDFDP